jgi:hypothetical protein
LLAGWVVSLGALGLGNIVGLAPFVTRGYRAVHNTIMGASGKVNAEATQQTATPEYK